MRTGRRWCILVLNLPALRVPNQHWITNIESSSSLSHSPLIAILRPNDRDRSTHPKCFMAFWCWPLAINSLILTTLNRVIVVQALFIYALLSLERVIWKDPLVTESEKCGVACCADFPHRLKKDFAHWLIENKGKWNLGYIVRKKCYIFSTI